VLAEGSTQRGADLAQLLERDVLRYGHARHHGRALHHRPERVLGVRVITHELRHLDQVGHSVLQGMGQLVADHQPLGALRSRPTVDILDADEHLVVGVVEPAGLLVDHRHKTGGEVVVARQQADLGETPAPEPEHLARVLLVDELDQVLVHLGSCSELHRDRLPSLETGDLRHHGLDLAAQGADPLLLRWLLLSADPGRRCQRCRARQCCRDKHDGDSR